MATSKGFAFKRFAQGFSRDNCARWRPGNLYGRSCVGIGTLCRRRFRKNDCARTSDCAEGEAVSPRDGGPRPEAGMADSYRRSPCVMSLVRQGVAASMAEHVRVSLEC